MDFFVFGVPQTSRYHYASGATGWTAPNIHPHIRIWQDSPDFWTPPGYTGSTASTPAGCAAVFNGWINYFDSNSTLRDKKVSLFIQNFGSGVTGSPGPTHIPQIFNHASDLALIPAGATQHTRTPYCSNGIAEARSWIDQFLIGISGNVSRIDYINEDIEFSLQGNTLFDFWLAFGTGTTSDWGWFFDALNDSRATTQLVDGYQTYSNFVSTNFSTAEQTLIANTSYRWNDVLWPSLCKMFNFSQRVIRYALWKAYFEAFYQANPNIRISSYGISNYTKQIPFINSQKPWLQAFNPDWDSMKQLPWYKSTFAAPVAYGSEYDSPGGSTAAFAASGHNIFGNLSGGYTATTIKFNRDIVGYATLANKKYHAQRIPGAIGAETVIPWITWDHNGLTFGDIQNLVEYYDSIGVQAINVWYNYEDASGAPNGSLTGVLSQLASLASQYTT